jgi:hypothetical protein
MVLRDQPAWIVPYSIKIGQSYQKGLICRNPVILLKIAVVVEAGGRPRYKCTYPPLESLS